MQKSQDANQPVYQETGTAIQTSLIKYEHMIVKERRSKCSQVCS